MAVGSVVGVGVAVGTVVGVGVAVGSVVGVGVAVGTVVGVGEGSSVGVAVGSVVGVGVAVGSRVGVGIGVLVGVGLGVGVGGGSSSDRLFCGLETACSTKSLALLSESSPFPSVSSSPPVPIVRVVDVEEAFRSILPSEDGVAVLADSKSTAPPIPTLSTTVVPASL